MPLRTRDGRVVIDWDIEHGSHDSCDSFFTHASALCPHCDQAKDLTDDELDALTEDYPETLEESWFEAQVGAAEAYWEGDR